MNGMKRVMKCRSQGMNGSESASLKYEQFGNLIMIGYLR